MGFGGPLALVALMEQEFVNEKKWVSKKRFESTFLFCKMLPGPIAYQMALWTGHELRGKIGGLLAGSFFILPSATLLYLLGRFYGVLEGANSLKPFLDGMKVGALVVILQSIGSLFAPYQKMKSSYFYALFGAIGMVLFPRMEPIIILGGGILSILFLYARRNSYIKLSSWSVLWALFFTHFKAGAFVFGTGLAIIPVLERESVQVYGWLSRLEFLDALSFSQITPGPITTMASFIGYKAARELGSLAATFGMYLPGALIVLGLLPWARKRLETQAWLNWFQWGAVPTVIGCLAASSYWLLKSALISVWAFALFFLLLAVQWKRRLPAWAIIFLASLGQAVRELFFS